MRNAKMKGRYFIMEMTLRWYGSKFDTITLKQIRQIPGVKGVITTLYDTAPGKSGAGRKYAQ